jgi:uncharacterized protein
VRRLLPILFGLAISTTGAPAQGADVVPLKLPSGKTLQVEVMATDADRAMGLMFRKSLPADRGLLFVFPAAGQYPFWMKNCRFPIDIVWLDEKRKVVFVAADVPPCKTDPCPSYGGMQRALYVVEVNAGQAAREKVTVGSVLDFKPPSAAR